MPSLYDSPTGSTTSYGTTPLHSTAGVRLVAALDSHTDYSRKTPSPTYLQMQKRKKQFRKLFGTLTGCDHLHDCYSCALYRDSIAAGHLYISTNWICFCSKLMGRHKQVAINVGKIIDISREKTAKIIPNAIKITTSTHSYVFSSFLSRDRAFKTLVIVWKQATTPLPVSDVSDADSLQGMESMTGSLMKSLDGLQSDLENCSVRSSILVSDGYDQDDDSISTTWEEAPTELVTCQSRDRRVSESKQGASCTSVASERRAFPDHFRQVFIACWKQIRAVKEFLERQITLDMLVIFMTCLLCFMTAYHEFWIAQLERRQSYAVISRSTNCCCRDPDVLQQLLTITYNQQRVLEKAVLLMEGLQSVLCKQHTNLTSARG